MTITFGRVAELKRHHNSVHEGFGGKKPQFWCTEDQCRRSRNGGGMAFSRFDKMTDHLKRVHKDKVGGDD